MLRRGQRAQHGSAKQLADATRKCVRVECYVIEISFFFLISGKDNPLMVRYLGVEMNGQSFRSKRIQLTVLTLTIY